MGYKVCVASTISIGTQIEPWEADTQEPIDDADVTQEPTTEMEHPMVIDLEIETQEPVNGIVVK